MAQADFTRISTNIAALNTLNSLRNINNKLGRAQLRLATGKRLNEAADDPAGLTIALKMRARSEGLKAAFAPGAEVVWVDPRYFRPTVVESLLVDASKSRRQLRWQPRFGFAALVSLMMWEDLLPNRLD